MYRIKYPLTVVTDQQKYFFIYALQAELQWEYTFEGSKVKSLLMAERNGEITQEYLESTPEYQRWATYQRDYYDPSFKAISDEIKRLRAEAFRRNLYRPVLTSNLEKI
jgi:hypothetical protein